MSTNSDDLRTQLVGFFFEESSEGLEVMESGLVGLDVDEPDAEEINSIFRAIHSVKGASGSFGFGHISEFAHHAETLLDTVRAGERRLCQEIVDVLLRATDCLGMMIQAVQGEDEADQARVLSVQRELQEMLERGPSPASVEPLPHEAATTARPVHETVKGGPVLWKISFRPHPSMLSTGNDPVRILRELAELGDLQVEADLDQLPPFEALQPEDCHLSWNLLLESCEDEATILDVFSWVEDDCDLALSRVGSEEPDDHVGLPSETSEAKVSPGPETPAAGDQHPGREDADAIAEDPPGRRPGPLKAAAGSIRVSTEKVDDLVNMVGELVITQSMLGEIGTRFEPSDIERLRDGLAQLERNTRELQEAVMKIRMLPISVTFARFPRLVRDISQALGKKVELVTEGEQTELDKNVLERIGDPLVHLIRNSLDHGLELPDERIAAGKPEVGVIGLTAYHQGGSIVIEVEDDGRGLDKERIRRKAIDCEVIGPDDVLTDERLCELIFHPGLSTKEQVTDVSGRGVGMDVVKKNITSLGGTIGIHSEQGRGTTTTVRLPLTLAILDGQLVRVGDQTYIVPLISIVESLQVLPESINSLADRMEVYRLRDEAIPIIRLFQLFDVVPDNPDIENGLMVVVEGPDGEKAGIVIDELAAQQQVVIKSLESNYARVEGLSGATILGDGTVALILDVAGLIRSAADRGAYAASAMASARKRQEERLCRRTPMAADADHREGDEAPALPPAAFEDATRDAASCDILEGDAR